MTVFLLGFLLCWAVQGGLSSPLLPLGPDYEETTITQSMSPETWPSLSRGNSQLLGTLGNRANTANVTAAQLDNFKRYAQWAGASYCGPVADKSVFCQGDICPAGGDANAVVHDVFYGTITDILAFLAISPATSEIIISVRGTSSLANWLANILWTREPTTLCPGCAVHLGFLAAYNDIVRQVNASLLTTMALYPHYKITITGHSLGGAVATLLACHFRDSLRGALMSNRNTGGVSLYTYGSPRVGNLALATYVTQQQSGRASGGNWRLTHAADVVPRMPPAIEGYRHVSPEYWLTGGAGVQMAYRPDQVLTCDGYASTDCNAGEPWWEVDLDSHRYYLVAISRCGDNDTTAMDRVPFGRGSMGSSRGNGTTEAEAGPVNGTTAMNSSLGNATSPLDGGGLLTPDTIDTLAMYAKLDQEYMAALAETGDTA